MVDYMREYHHRYSSGGSASIGPFQWKQAPHLDRVLAPAEVLRVPDAKVGAEVIVEGSMLRVILAGGATEALPAGP